MSNTIIKQFSLNEKKQSMCFTTETSSISSWLSSHNSALFVALVPLDCLIVVAQLVAWALLQALRSTNIHYEDIESVLKS